MRARDLFSLGVVLYEGSIVGQGSQARSTQELEQSAEFIDFSCLDPAAGRVSTTSGAPAPPTFAFHVIGMR